MKRLFCLLVAACAVPAAAAQESPFSAGPQMTTLGVGAGASYFVTPRVSVSAEANFLPKSDVTTEIDGLEYASDVYVGGGLLLANFHPTGGKFSVGAGLFVGGYRLDGTVTPAGPVEVGDRTYQPEEIGTLVGDFRVNGPVPVLMLGWRGPGFNLGVGVTTGYASRFDLEATGPVADSAEFRENVERERQEIEDAVKGVPVIPYLRIGWQFSL